MNILIGKHQWLHIYIYFFNGFFHFLHLKMSVNIEIKTPHTKLNTYSLKFPNNIIVFFKYKTKHSTSTTPPTNLTKIIG